MNDSEQDIPNTFRGQLKMIILTLDDYLLSNEPMLEKWLDKMVSLRMPDEEVLKSELLPIFDRNHVPDEELIQDCLEEIQALYRRYS